MNAKKMRLRNDGCSAGKGLMLAALPTLGLLIGLPAFAAEPGFPVTLTQPDRAQAKCFVLTEPKDGVPSVQRYSVDVSPKAVVISLHGPEDRSLNVAYDREADGRLKPTPRVSMSGGEMDASTNELERKMAEGMLGGMIGAIIPASAIFPVFQSVKAGDAIYADDYAAAIMDMVSLTHLEDAKRTSLQNGVTARRVDTAGGRPVLFAEGEFSANYMTPRGTARVSLAGTHEVDAATGLVRSSRIVTKVTRGSVAAYEDVETEYCDLSPPPPTPASACGDVRSRLEALDSLVKSGLVTEAEAAEKRAAILKSL